MIIISAMVIVMGCLFFNYQVSPISKDTTEIIFEVPVGATYSSLGSSLKEIGLVRSELFFKMYIKLFKPETLEAGKYKLTKSMSMKEILETLESGSKYNPDAFMITIPEGKNMEQIASIIANKTNISESEFLKTINSSEFIDKVISKYWFVTEEVKNKDIRYALEGYLFPSTYELANKDVKVEDIAYKMLNQMEKVLNDYKDEIEGLKYNIHEILTMASIVEYEAILDEDRPLVASVFYNRLDSNMKLQSCATLGYAIGKFKLTYTYKDMQTKSLYNTYYYSGLPVGPGGMPSKESIDASIRPATSDYYYFMANVCDPTSQKTYFSKTLSEHNKKVDKYLTCF